MSPTSVKAGIQLDTKGVERAIHSIRNPEERAVLATTAHREARALTSRLSAARRQALIDLHNAGWTWQEVADAVSLSTKAVLKAVHGPGDSDQWWKRISDDVANQVKRGPGGVPRERLVPKAELMNVVLATMTEHERKNRPRGEAATRITPREILAESSKRFKKSISIASLRNALLALVEEGKVVRVAYGCYALAEKPSHNRTVARKKRGRKAT